MRIAIFLDNETPRIMVVEDASQIPRVGDLVTPHARDSQKRYRVTLVLWAYAPNDEQPSAGSVSVHEDLVYVLTKPAVDEA